MKDIACKRCRILYDDGITSEGFVSLSMEILTVQFSNAHNCSARWACVLGHQASEGLVGST